MIIIVRWLVLYTLGVVDDESLKEGRVDVVYIRNLIHIMMIYNISVT